MEINHTYFNASCTEIVEELQRQLAINKIPLLQKTKDVGKDIQVQCPYHGNGQERKPSAGIRKSDGMFHCFACNEVHSLQEVISYCFGYTDDLLGNFGWKWLNKNFSAVEVEERQDVKIDLERNNISNKGSVGNNKLDNSDSNKSVFVSEEELDNYRYYHKYWATRGITDDNIIELFDLGYDSKTDCITFPVRDIDGNCLFVARRNVKTKFFNYPKGVEKPLYGLYELHKTKTFMQKQVIPYYNSDYIKQSENELFVCESMIDCILLWQAGHYAVALNGLGSSLQLKQLRELPCRKLILATDNDDAGERARFRIKSNVRNKIITEIEFPDGIKDVGECSEYQIQNIARWEVF